MTLLATVTQLFQHSPNELHPLNWLDTLIMFFKQVIRLGGTLVISAGACVAFLRYVRWRFHKRARDEFNAIRLHFGQTILLGLEFIVAADVIETTIAPDYYALGILIVVVAIRMMLSTSLSKEIALDRVNKD